MFVFPVFKEEMMRVRVSEEKDENGKALSATYQDVDENVVLMDKEMLEILNF